ncbi:MAG: septum site-determining protein MinD [Christensenellaceae bacterium]|jgi:septum site-determining protein MinD|nr:septum site-determining protein MinD [Christensenellaceae bacterium]
MGRRIVITSGKGGVGKTTVTANLGLALTFTGAKVVVVDADISLNNLDLVLELENHVIYDIGDLIAGQCTIKDAIVSDYRNEGLFLLPSSKISLDKMTLYQFSSVVSELSNIFDYVLVDSPAGIDNGFHISVQSCHEAIIVTTPHISALRDANKVANIITQYRLSNVNLVVNRIRADMVQNGNMIEAKEISELLRIPLIATLPDDDEISISGLIKNPNGARITEKAYKAFAKNVLLNSHELYDCEKQGVSIFSRFFKIKGKK